MSQTAIEKAEAIRRPEQQQREAKAAWEGKRKEALKAHTEALAAMDYPFTSKVSFIDVSAARVQAASQSGGNDAVASNDTSANANGALGQDPEAPPMALGTGNPDDPNRVSEAA